MNFHGMPFDTSLLLQPAGDITRPLPQRERTKQRILASYYVLLAEGVACCV